MALFGQGLLMPDTPLPAHAGVMDTAFHSRALHSAARLDGEAEAVFGRWSVGAQPLSLEM